MYFCSLLSEFDCRGQEICKALEYIPDKFDEALTGKGKGPANHGSRSFGATVELEDWKLGTLTGHRQGRKL